MFSTVKYQVPPALFVLYHYRGIHKRIRKNTQISMDVVETKGNTVSINQEQISSY